MKLRKLDERKNHQDSLSACGHRVNNSGKQGFKKGQLLPGTKTRYKTRIAASAALS